jgi:hypothetical protein
MALLGPDQKLPPFVHLPVGAIRPTGWLERQLRIQAEGITGRLDEFWPDITNSAWIGGDGEGWERAPYWLDGLVPLAYLLDDGPLIEKVQSWLGFIMDSQHSDGWLGPERDPARGENATYRDPWPAFIILKALTQYYEATAHQRVLDSIHKALTCLKRDLQKRPVSDWAKYRWPELLISILWMRARTGEEWLTDFAHMIRRQGYDWFAHFQDLPLKQRAVSWTYEGHVVNNAMGLKLPGLWYLVSGASPYVDASARAMDELDHYHGQAGGLFSGDECLAGRNPSQGTELCAVVEYMYSLEELSALTTRTVFADRLERLAYNALPAAFTRDMTAHQYDQQANQIACKSIEQPIYTTNGPDSNVFGLEPNFGCCTANLHQGWPKFATHLWAATRDGGVAAVAYGPSRTEVWLKGLAVGLEEETNYPFDDRIEIRVSIPEPTHFPLLLRIPQWCSSPRVMSPEGPPANAEPGTYHRIDRTWRDGDTVVVELPSEGALERRYNDAVAVNRGPLLFALPLDARWTEKKKRDNHVDWTVEPQEPWQYGIAGDPESIDRTLQFERSEPGEVPFSLENPPIHCTVPIRGVSNWDDDRGAAGEPPKQAEGTGSTEARRLVPYGCTALRLTEFPVVDDE